MAKKARLPEARLATGHHLKWEVRWVKSVGDGDYKIVVYECGNDLNEAIRIYGKAVAGGKKMATLRCANSGFPPPEELRPYTKRKKKEVKVGRRLKMQWVEVSYNPMRTKNNKGIFWCPYCRELRRFQRQEAMFIQGVVVPEPGLHCPICGVSHRDYHVRQWNPVAARTYHAESAGTKVKTKRWTLNAID